jgi:hypothetical protein
MLRAEVNLLDALRRRYRSVLGEELAARLERVLALASCPTCAESQADGVPCPSPERACDHCARALQWVRDLRKEIESAAVARQARRGDDWEI